MPSSEKGFAPIIIAIVIAGIIGASILGYKYWKRGQDTHANPTTTATTTPSPTPSDSIVPIPTFTMITSSPTPSASPSPSSSSSSSSSNSDTSTSPSLTPSPTPTPSPTQAAVGNTITVDTTSVTVTLSRANNSYDIVKGSGFTMTGHGDVIGYLIQDNQGHAGYGFSESSGGIRDSISATVHTYINSNTYQNGTYSGTATVRAQHPDNSYTDGPTVSYTIILTD